MRTVDPESSGGSPSATVRRVLVGVLLMAVTAIVALGWDWATAEIMTRREADIQAEIERERATEESATRTPDDAAAVQQDDTAEAEAGSGSESDRGGDEPAGEDASDEEEPSGPGIWSLVEPLAPQPPGPGILLLDDLGGGSAAEYRSADYDEAGFDQELKHLWSEAVPVHAPFGQEVGLSNRWNLTLGSDGPAVAVTDLALADLECGPARAVAAFDLPAQGSDDRLLISYSMENPTMGRLYEYTESGDRAPGWGEPFFEQKVVELGGSTSSVGFMVEVVTTDEDCTWSAFELSLYGPEGEETYRIERDGGEPFEARGVAADADTFFAYHDDGGPDIYADPLW
ncbi:hypothetical protein [Promicromonospora kroppenstedtii]|uniref:hypothetical protein n=1 Tax=Promicromonospora kroppenstedtii TaxID=440482 RepID=UPI00055EDF7D|nr:hypothetical protein [Promicromonospora kroppenstedtii]